MFLPGRRASSAKPASEISGVRLQCVESVKRTFCHDQFNNHGLSFSLIPEESSEEQTVAGRCSDAACFAILGDVCDWTGEAGEDPGFGPSGTCNRFEAVKSMQSMRSMRCMKSRSTPAARREVDRTRCTCTCESQMPRYARYMNIDGSTSAAPFASVNLVESPPCDVMRDPTRIAMIHERASHEGP
nr:hypothetical protein CFP56_43765 [Quercus suber]